MNTAEVVVGEMQRDSALWFSSFFENALVNRVRRRICIRIVRFCRSTCEVQILEGSGSPLTATGTASPCGPGNSAVRSWMRLRIEFDKLREIAAIGQHFIYGGAVGLQTVAG